MEKINTVLCHYGEESAKKFGSVVPPIYQNSLFTFEKWDSLVEAFSSPDDSYIYTRGNNPSVEVVENKIAKICKGEKARLFSSGMGAISSVLMHCLNNGDHVIVAKNVYSTTSNFIKNYLTLKFNITYSIIEDTDIEVIKSLINDKTKAIYLESPTSKLLTMYDISKITELAKERNIKTIIDNTWATPVFFNPLQLGIDFEIHSCSKYIGGHSDIVAGVVIATEKEINAISHEELSFLGAKIAPFEAWLIMRSLRTLPLRMRQHFESAVEVTNFLENHKCVREVFYPALKSSQYHDLWKKQMSGAAGVFAFNLNTNNVDNIIAFINKLKIFKIGISWGGHESLVYATSISNLEAVKAQKKTEFPLGMIRLSIGLENVEDLIEDLREALKCIEE